MVVGTRFPCAGSKVRNGGVKADEELGFFREETNFLDEHDDSRASNFDNTTPTRKRKSSTEISRIRSQFSSFECLPPDILVKVVCDVDHGDLKQLFHVSRSVREATLVAKETHFEYSTPSKVKAFREWSGGEDENSEEIKAPNAPKQERRHPPRSRSRKLADISVALFASDDERWPRRMLVMEPAA